MKMRCFICITFLVANANAQLLKETYKLGGSSSLPSSNSVSQIVIEGSKVFLGTDKGLNLTTDGGKTFQTNFGQNSPTGISVNAIAIKGDTIVVAVSTTLDQSGTTYPVGKGMYTSTDNGATWTSQPQSLDSLRDSTVVFGIDTLKALPVTTAVNNISYDLAFHKGFLYTSNFAGGLRRSTDLGKTWERVVIPPDYLDFISADSSYTFQLSPVSGNITSESNLNHRIFSVFSDGDSVLYVGTADGINKSTNNGYTWYKFDHQNQANPISGNFVVSINSQDLSGVHHIWAATVNAEASDEVPALSYSADGGLDWKQILSGHFFHGMAFYGDIVYGVSDDGLFRTSDYGHSSQVITNVYDSRTGQSTLSPAFYAAATSGDTLWAGSSDGTVKGVDDGVEIDPASWQVFRAYVPVAATHTTYFYPNPFSPHLDVGRIHYSINKTQSTVTIRIYDFAMHVISTVLQNATRTTGEQDEPWNGTDDGGKNVDNGVYFYSVALDGGNPIWGKILVVR